MDSIDELENVSRVGLDPNDLKVISTLELDGSFPHEKTQGLYGRTSEDKLNLCMK